MPVPHYARRYPSYVDLLEAEWKKSMQKMSDQKNPAEHVGDFHILLVFEDKNLYNIEFQSDFRRIIPKRSYGDCFTHPLWRSE